MRGELAFVAFCKDSVASIFNYGTKKTQNSSIFSSKTFRFTPALLKNIVLSIRIMPKSPIPSQFLPSYSNSHFLPNCIKLFLATSQLLSSFSLDPFQLFSSSINFHFQILPQISSRFSMFSVFVVVFQKLTKFSTKNRSQTLE